MMGVDRIIRVNELLKREIGGALFYVLKDMDISTITITSVKTSRDLRNARVMVSVRGDDDQRRSVLSCLRGYRIDIQKIINKNLTLKYTPRLSFVLDCSIEKGSHILDILLNMEEEIPKED